MKRVPDIARRLAIYCLALGLGGLGPGVLATLPNTLNFGAEEESRCAVTHVAGSVPAARERPSGLPDAPPTTGDRRTSRRHARVGVATHGPVLSLCDLKVRIQV